MTFVTPPNLPTTVTTPFGTCDSKLLPLYTVREGIPLEDALVQISLLLKCAGESAYELSDCGLKQRGLLWSTLHSIETAKALTEALMGGVG
jgi:hypothetical protein